MNLVISIIALVIIMAIITFFSITFRFYDPFGIGISKARRDFPEVAEKLGLEFTPPALKEHLGELNGELGGYTVRVSPDDSAIIELALRERIEVHLSNDEPVRSHANEDMNTFDFHNKAANKLFTTRFASPNLVHNLASSKKLFDFTETFNSHWGREVSRLEYSNGYVFARFRYGFGNYIPAKNIQPMLDDLVVLAELLESL